MMFVRLLLLSLLASMSVALTAKNTSSPIASDKMDVDRPPRAFYPFTVPKAGYKFLEVGEMAVQSNFVNGTLAMTTEGDFAEHRNGDVELTMSCLDYLFAADTLFRNFSTCMANASTSTSDDLYSELHALCSTTTTEIVNADGTYQTSTFSGWEEVFEESKKYSPADQQTKEIVIQALKNIFDFHWYSPIEGKALGPGQTEKYIQESPNALVNGTTTLVGYSSSEKAHCAVFLVETNHVIDMGGAHKLLSHAKDENSGSELSSVFEANVHIHETAKLYFDYVNEFVVNEEANTTIRFAPLGSENPETLQLFFSSKTEITDFPAFVKAPDDESVIAQMFRGRPQLRRVF